jgi:predicted ATPase
VHALTAAPFAVASRRQGGFNRIVKGNAPYLQRLQLLPERVTSFEAYPFVLPVIQRLDLEFQRPITFLIGENGSGKSTILEALAGILDLPLTGGGRADVVRQGNPADDHDLARALRPSFRQRPRDAYFFRGEFIAHYAQLLDARKADPSFWADPYAAYGGKPLLTQSHGEGFLAVMQNRIEKGLYLLDEPEAALSPQRQLVLMALIAQRAQSGAQFIVATHSPILMTIPGARIMQIEGATISQVALEDTEHYQITKSVLSNPAAFWKHLAPLD